MSYPQQYAGPAGAGQMAPPLQPPPAPPAPASVATPYASESFAPGDMAFFTYHDHRDPEGVNRTQVAVVAHVDENHVHAVVLADASQLASFVHGQLTHGYPG